MMNHNKCSEFHGVGLVVKAQGESGVEVLFQNEILGVFDVFHDGSINGLLRFNSAGVDLLGLNGLVGVWTYLLVGEDGGISGLLCLLVGEDCIVNLADINSLEVDLGAGSQCIHLVHSLEGNTVDLVGACHEEEA